MNLTKYLGDSYDIVKQSLLRWLSDFGDWSVYPMFTQPEAAADIEVYERLLGAQVIKPSVLNLNDEAERALLFSSASSCSSHLLLDPDTGLQIHGQKLKNPMDAAKYVREDELLIITTARPNKMTIVFDQSVGYGMKQIRPRMEKKLLQLQKRGVHGFAYLSHACFLVVGQDKELIMQAHAKVIELSRLPSDRLTKVF